MRDSRPSSPLTHTASAPTAIRSGPPSSCSRCWRTSWTGTTAVAEGTAMTTGGVAAADPDDGVAEEPPVHAAASRTTLTQRTIRPPAALWPRRCVAATSGRAQHEHGHLGGHGAKRDERRADAGGDVQPVLGVPLPSGEPVARALTDPVVRVPAEGHLPAVG